MWTDTLRRVLFTVVWECSYDEISTVNTTERKARIIHLTARAAAEDDFTSSVQLL